MDSVIGEELADILIEAGSMPIFHRFTTFETQLAWVKKYGENTFISCGLRHEDQTYKLLEAGAAGVCMMLPMGTLTKCLLWWDRLRRTFLT